MWACDRLGSMGMAVYMVVFALPPISPSIRRAKFLVDYSLHG